MFAVAQITTLGAFIVSYFPGKEESIVNDRCASTPSICLKASVDSAGGIRVLYMVKDLIVERAKGAFGRGGNTSVLPL